MEYAKELMLHLSNIIHQAGSGKRELVQEIDKRDAQIQEKDAQIREKDAQIRDKDAHIARIHPRIVEVEVSDELLECQLCKKKTKFGKRIGRDQTLACLECISQA